MWLSCLQRVFFLDSGKINFPIQRATIKIGLSIIRFKGSQVDFPNKCVLQSLNNVFIIANSADPDKMQQTTLSGISCIQRVYSPLSDEFNQVMSPWAQKHKKISLSETTRPRAIIKFVASSCEPLPSLIKLCLWRPKMVPPRMSRFIC